MKIALLGFPESGRRTLFALLTGRTVHEGKLEEGTVEGVARVRDPRVDAIAERVKPQKIKYAELDFVLCPDVETGAGARIWLEPARSCDALCTVVRAFADPSVYHPKGSVEAERDRRDLEAEFLLADLEMVEKRLDRIGKERRSGQTAVQVAEEKALLKCKEGLEASRGVLTLGLEKHEVAAVRGLGLLTLKANVWTYNVDDADVAHVRPDGALSVACKIEQEMSTIDNPRERQEYLEAMGLSLAGVDRMSAAVYDAMGLMSFYTMGADEVRAWTIRKESLAPQAAGKVHSDMERGFIRVEVVKYDDLIAAGSEAAVRHQGKVALRGKDYVIEDGDICSFLFSV